MKVTHFPCGPANNKSELTALIKLKNYLESMQGQDEWILLTNLTLSVTHQFQSDEIDMVVVGPPGVRVIEVKHWTAKWVNANEKLVEHAAELVTSKARKIGTTLRKVVQSYLKPILQGLQQQIDGLYHFANKAGDRHSKLYKPSKHHAQLAVNVALTLCQFLLESYKYEKEHNQSSIAKN